MGPGVPVDAVPARGDGAPGLSMGGIAGLKGGALLAVHWMFPFLFVVFPTFFDPLHVIECMVASSHSDIFSLTDISCSERRG